MSTFFFKQNVVSFIRVGKPISTLACGPKYYQLIRTINLSGIQQKTPLTSESQHFFLFSVNSRVLFVAGVDPFATAHTRNEEH